MGIEIERKYLINRLPEQPETYPYHLIEQAYLTKDPTIRVRKQDELYFLTYKGKGTLAHEEYNLPLTKEAYETLVAKTDSRLIRKKRILIPYQEYTIELDCFEAPFAPLIVAEVEFSSIDEANAFLPPCWFGREVTDDRRYCNSYLAFTEDLSYTSV